MTKPMLSPHTAVFNGHVNDAFDKVRILMEKFYPKHLERIDQLDAEGDGIMHIFSVEPEDATIIYVALVTAIVNQDRIVRDPDYGEIVWD